MIVKFPVQSKTSAPSITEARIVVTHENEPQWILNGAERPLVRESEDAVMLRMSAVTDNESVVKSTLRMTPKEALEFGEYIVSVAQKAMEKRFIAEIMSEKGLS